MTEWSNDRDLAQAKAYERIMERRAQRASTSGGDGAHYVYRTLTKALEDRNSPLRQYFDRRFPNIRPLQADYRAEADALLVEAGPANAGTVGAAFDCLVRFLLVPETDVPLAYRRFERDRPRHVEAIVEVVARAQSAARQGAVAQDHLARACWALALCIEVYRTRVVMPGSPLSLLEGENRFTAEGLLSTAPADAIRQLAEMRLLAEAKLLPHLKPPFVLGPTFKEIGPCAADADIIAGGWLIDLKTRLGTKNARGVRSDTLKNTEVYQLLGYAMFDTSDVYGINTIGIYSARYGVLAVWPLQDALETTAEDRVDLAEERDRVRALIYQ